MTIAAGFICSDGVVTAADTQESITGFMKGNTQKILTVTTPDWQCSITGAGYSDYVEMAKQKLFFSPSENGDHPASHNDSGILDYIEKRAIEIFKTNFAPLAVYPEQERPVAELLISAQLVNGRGTIIRWNGAATTRHQDRAFAGNGALLAANLADKLLSVERKLSMREMSGLAIFMLKEVKASIDGCGGNTDVLLIGGNGEYGHLATAEVRRAEEQYEELEKRSTSILTSGNCVPSSYR